MAFWIFLSFLVLYVGLTRGRLISTDEVEVYQATQSLWEHGDFSIPSPEGTPGRGGRRYAVANSGLSIAAVPLYGLGKAAENFIRSTGGEDWLKTFTGRLSERAGGDRFGGDMEIFCVNLFNCIATALLCALFYRFSLRVGAAPRFALLATALLGTASYIAPFSTGFFQHPSEALLLLGAFYFLFADRQHPSSWARLLAGICAAVALQVRFPTIVSLPALGLYQLAIVWTRRPAARKWREDLKRVAWELAPFSAALFVGFLLHFLDQYNKFGTLRMVGRYSTDPFDTPPLIGIYGFLFSPGGSIFLFTPLLGLVFWTFPAFARRNRLETGFILLTFCSYLALYCHYGMWLGLYNYGPRYVAATVPLLMLPVGPWMEKARVRGWLSIVLLSLLGLWVQATYFLVDFWWVVLRENYLNFQPKNGFIWIPGSCQFVAHSRALLAWNECVDTWLVYVYRNFGTLRFAEVLLPLLVLLAFCLWRLREAVRDSAALATAVPRVHPNQHGVEVTVLMPCLNEEKTLGECLEQARGAMDASGVSYELLVADNGSSDDSVAVAASQGARVVSTPRRGYGAALIAGIAAARGRYVVMGDADCSYDFREAPGILRKLKEGFDLVMGNRFAGGIEEGAMPLMHHHLGNPALTWVARVLYGIQIRDIHCGLRGFSREAIASLELAAPGMEFASEMVVKASLANLRIAEVPATLRPDKRNRGPHLRPWRDGWRHLKLLFRCSPARIWFWPSAVLAAVVVLLAYSNHFQNGFQFDDAHTIVNNAAIRSLRNVPRFFTDGTTFSVLPANQSYRPLVSLSLAIDYALGGGLNPFFFQASDFAWFLLTGVLVGLLVHWLLERNGTNPRNSWLALLAGTSFALNPANADAVNYVIARSDLISTAAILAGLALYAIPERRSWGLSLIVVALGMLAKPVTAVFAPLAALFLLLFLFKSWRGYFVAITPPVLVCGGMAAFISWMTPKTWVPGAGSGFQYLITQPYVALLYFKTFFWPAGLSADYDLRAFSSMADPRFWAGMLFLVCMLGFGVFAASRATMRVVGFGLLWFVIALLPTSLTPLAEVMNDHRAFLAYVGLVIAIAGAADVTLERSSALDPGFKRAVALVVLLVLGAGAAATYDRNAVWRDDVSLWKDTALKSPGNGRALMNYGNSLMAKGDLVEALGQFHAAQKLMPYYPYLYVNLAVAENAMGDEAGAERDFNTGLRLGPMTPDCYTFYADWLMDHSRPDEGEALAKKALELSPGDLKARELLTRAPEAETSSQDYLARSITDFRAGRLRECIAAAQQALRLNPDSAEAYNTMGAAWNSLGQYDLGANACLQALKLKPDFSLARNNLKYALEMRARAAAK